MLLSGAQASRAEQIKLLSTPDAPDVLVTSYPLIRRDAPLLSGVSFRFAILDEAQQIKNSASVGAHAVKQLSAETRIALHRHADAKPRGRVVEYFRFHPARLSAPCQRLYAPLRRRRKQR